MINIDNIKIKAKPDFGRIVKALKREGKPDRVPFYELKSDIDERVVGNRIKKGDCKDETDYLIKCQVYCQKKLGYDNLNCKSTYVFPRPSIHSENTGTGNVEYVQGSDAMITNEEEFEKYKWPELKESDLILLRRTAEALPEGMKIIVRGKGGVLENVMWIMGYEGMSYALIENPGLIERMFEAVGSRVLKLLKTYAEMDFVGAVTLGDDMGFKTQTMFSPETLIKYVMPWHKKIVEAVHAKGKPAILHSCGNLEKIYEEIIGCGWDAKHSYEDVILPAWDFKEKYGKRISVAGGFDLNKLCLLTPEEIRKHTRFLIDKCGNDGGYVLGSGNSIAHYVPAENYLTMLEEGFNYGKQ